MRRVNATDARQLIAEKQSVEVGLSLDVQEIFDVEMIPDLRQMCQASIAKVAAMAEDNREFANDYPGKWSFYGCMKGMNQWNADTLFNHSLSWTTSDCGDWIRVYGEIIEAKKFFSQKQDAMRTAPQLGGDKGYWKKPPAPSPSTGQTSGDQALHQPNLEASKLRRRLDYKTLTIHDQGLYDLETTESGFLMKSMMFSGIKKWAIMANDVTGKMDRVFGLMKGATISGTTTDNIYFLNKFGKDPGSDPVSPADREHCGRWSPFAAGGGDPPDDEQAHGLQRQLVLNADSERPSSGADCIAAEGGR
jgi:hypothetical protein